MYKFNDVVTGFWQLGRQYLLENKADQLPTHVKLNFDQYHPHVVTNVVFNYSLSTVTVLHDHVEFRLINGDGEVFFIRVGSLCKHAVMQTSENWSAWVSQYRNNPDGDKSLTRTDSVCFEIATAYIPQHVTDYLSDCLDREESSRLHQTSVKIANFHSFKLN